MAPANSSIFCQGESIFTPFFTINRINCELNTIIQPKTLSCLLPIVLLIYYTTFHM